MSIRFAKLGCVLLLLSACRGGAQRGATPPADGSAPKGASPEAEAGPCAPQQLGLGAAKPLGNWQPPPGCQGPSGSGSARVVIRSEADFKLNFRCTPEVPSGVNFSNNDLIVSGRLLSPAGAGTTVFDDGKTTTIVSLSRDPCPNSPLPMPMGYTLAFLLPANATRAFVEQACTLERHCD